MSKNTSKLDNQNKQKQWWMYVLELENDKYYVGITSQTPEKRMQEHLDNVRAAYWTQKHKPIRILYSKNLGRTTLGRAEKYEQRVVREYMRKFGYNNVRGGDLTSVEDYQLWLGKFYDKLIWQGAVIIVFLVVLLFVIYFINN